jgi:hypothetical protein
MNHNGHPREYNFLSRLRKMNATEAKRWALVDAQSNCQAIVARCLNHLDSCDEEDPVTGMVRELRTRAIDLSLQYDTLINSNLTSFNVGQITEMFTPVSNLLAEVFQEINPAVMDKVSAAL